MSTEQRDQARDRFSHWQSLPLEQRHALRDRWQRFQALPPQEQEAVRQNYHRFQQLPPAQRQQLRQQWRNASPEQRRQMVEHAHQQHEKRTQQPQRGGAGHSPPSPHPR
jgi:TRAP-type C4-dicarboxylate transport system substrate-binding protein